MVQQREEGESTITSLQTAISSAKEDVSLFCTILPSLIKLLEHRLETFKAGKLTEYIDAWKTLTNDSEILDMIMGTTIEFHTQLTQYNEPPQMGLTPLECQVIDEEVNKLLGKGVIRKAHPENGEFISPIFLRPKKDGTNRMILNLKALNKHIQNFHFKMETLASATKLMTPKCFMATLDLKDAYYTVPIKLEHQKYLTFRWKDNKYKFVCFPNGLSLCPRKFTKLLKPLFAYLRQNGHLITSYIDDNYIQGNTYDECAHSVLDTIAMYTKLGFYIHPGKSHLNPTQEITYLGFVLNSITMTIKLTTEKASTIKIECESALQVRKITIRQVARILGLLVSCFPGVMWGPLHYRQLESDKTEALKNSKGNFNEIMQISEAAKKDIAWWVSNIMDSYNVISHGTPHVHLYSDASKTGWGGTCNGTQCGGPWTPTESALHINVLEIKAAFFTLKCFVHKLSNNHVRINIDYNICIFYQSHGHKPLSAM